MIAGSVAVGIACRSRSCAQLQLLADVGAGGEGDWYRSGASGRRLAGRDDAGRRAACTHGKHVGGNAGGAAVIEEPDDGRPPREDERRRCRAAASSAVHGAPDRPAAGAGSARTVAGTFGCGNSRATQLLELSSFAPAAGRLEPLDVVFSGVKWSTDQLSVLRLSDPWRSNGLEDFGEPPDGMRASMRLKASRRRRTVGDLGASKRTEDESRPADRVAACRARPDVRHQVDRGRALAPREAGTEPAQERAVREGGMGRDRSSMSLCIAPRTACSFQGLYDRSSVLCDGQW